MRRFSKEEKILRQILAWEKKHLQCRTRVNYNVQIDRLKSDSMDADYRNYIVTKEFIFLSDTSRQFNLRGYGEMIRQWLAEAQRLIEVFHERHAMRSKLQKLFREDTLYDRMEEIFYALMAQFLHAVNFFQYDRIESTEYRESAEKQVQHILSRADTLLHCYGSYLSLQGTSIYPDTAEDLADIRDAVDAMQEAFRTGGTAG